MSREISREELIRRRDDQLAQSGRWRLRAEQTKVTFLIRELHLGTAFKRELTKLAKDRTPEGHMTYDLFAEVVPTFPILLGHAGTDKVGKLHQDPKATIPALFRRFQDAPFVRAYEEHYEAAAPRAYGRAVGLTFSRNGVPNGLIMHDGTGLSSYWCHGVVWTYNAGTKERPFTLYVQPFDGLVRAIRGGEWRAELNA